MAKAISGDVRLEYDTVGSPHGVPLMIIQGLGDQLIKWNDGFHQALADLGFFVIRFDNRDAGLSTHFKGTPPPDLSLLTTKRLVDGADHAVPYRLQNMAADAVAVLDAVGVARAHIMGVSMGGMIAQLFAATFADRTASLISVMSSTGNPDLPPAKPEAMAALLASPPDPTDEPALLDHAVASASALGSPAYPVDPATLRASLASALHRNYDPEGVARQMAAIVVSGDRRNLLKTLRVPVLVIHGSDDPLVPVEAGRDTARTIPGAKLKTIAGMGHNLPPVLYGRIATMIAEFALN